MIEFSRSFHEFLRSLCGSESLDDSSVVGNDTAVERADFLMFDRSMIVEVKAIENDPGAKVQRIIDACMQRGDFPRIYGRVDFRDILAKLTQVEREQVAAEAYKAVTKALTGSLEKANSQIRSTRRTFNTPNAAGVAFVLNDQVQVLTPEVLVCRVQDELRKRTVGGNLRYAEISFVCIISWTHIVTATATPSYPIAVVESGVSRNNAIARGQLEYIINAWSFSQGAKLIDGNPASLERLREAVPTNKPSEKR